MQAGPIVNLIATPLGTSELVTTLSPPTDGQSYGAVAIYNSTNYTLLVSIAGSAISNWLQPNYADIFELPTPNSQIQITPQVPGFGLSIATVFTPFFIGLVTTTWYLKSESKPNGYPLPLTSAASGIEPICNGVSSPQILPASSILGLIAEVTTAGASAQLQFANNNFPPLTGLTLFTFSVPPGTRKVTLTTSENSYVNSNGPSATGVSLFLQGYSSLLPCPVIAISGALAASGANIVGPLSITFNIEDCNDTNYNLWVAFSGMGGAGNCTFNIAPTSIAAVLPGPALENGQNILYAIPSAPNSSSSSSGDHPPNELKGTGWSVTAVGTVLAAPGAGLRYRVYSANGGIVMGASGFTTAYLYDVGTGQGLFIATAGGVTDAAGNNTMTIPLSGLPCSTNNGLSINYTYGSGNNFTGIVYYTTETV